jgi:spore maturation protein CgeB
LAVNPQRYPFARSERRVPALVFAGKCSESRRAFFRELDAAGVPLEIFGPGAGEWWQVARNRRLAAVELARIYQQYVACLNLPQPGNTEYGLNLRAFEVPCCGGVGTYPAVPDVARCFTPNEEIMVYQNVPQLVEILRELSADRARVEQLAAAGRQRVLRDHTFECRARRMIADWHAARDE